MRYLVLLLVLMAGPAFGQAWTKPCVGGEAGSACYNFTGATDSSLIQLTAVSSTVCLDPDIASTGGAGTVFLRQCVACDTASTNTCEPVLVDQDGAPGVDNLPLNGDETAARRCLYAIPPGCYYVDVDTSAGGVTARVRAEGK